MKTSLSTNLSEGMGIVLFFLTDAGQRFVGHCFYPRFILSLSVSLFGFLFGLFFLSVFLSVSVNPNSAWPWEFFPTHVLFILKKKSYALWQKCICTLARRYSAYRVSAPFRQAAMFWMETGIILLLPEGVCFDNRRLDGLCNVNSSTEPFLVVIFRPVVWLFWEKNDFSPFPPRHKPSNHF